MTRQWTDNLLVEFSRVSAEIRRLQKRQKKLAEESRLRSCIKRAIAAERLFGEDRHGKKD